MCLFLTTSFANDNPVSMLEQLKFNQSPLFVVGFVLVYLLLFFGVFCLFDFFGFFVSFWFCCDCCLLLVFCLRCYFAQFSVERFISKMQVLLENTIWLFALGAIWFTQPAQPHRTGIKHPLRVRARFFWTLRRWFTLQPSPITKNIKGLF